MSNEGTLIQVEPAPEGPLVKPKRPMTEAQLEALKRGRAKLAEKRRQTKEAEESQSIQSSDTEPSNKVGLELTKSDFESEKEDTQEEEPEEQGFCSVM